MTTTTERGTQLEQRIGPRGRFTLRQASGNVAVRGVEGDTVRVRSLDDRALDDLFNVEVGDDFVTLRQRDVGIGLKLRGRHSGADLEIDVPHGATVAIETASAEVKARDLSGTKSFRTASGEVRLTRLAGLVEIETVSGEIELEGQAPVDLVARSISGDVEVRLPMLRRLDLGTTSGDIRLDAALSGDGPFAIRSISGDATIVGRNGFRVEAETITGDLSSDLPSLRESVTGRKILTIGRPGPTLVFRSVSGDFHVAKPRVAAAEPAEPTAASGTAAEGRSATTPPASNVTDTRPADPGAGDADAARLDILRQVERGEITVAEASERLAQLDEVIR